jgi:hypothetical protein
VSHERDAEAAHLLTPWKPAKKDSTLISNRGRIVRHIKPILGRISRRVPFISMELGTDCEPFMLHLYNQHCR